MNRKTEPNALDKDLVRMLAHPLRVQILIILNQRVASPREMSEDLEKPLSSVAHHTKVLQECKVVERVRTEQGRGGNEHFYRAVRRQFFTDQDWESIPEGLRGEIAKVTLQALLNDVDDAMVRGTFGELADYHLSRTPMVVDRKGWEEVSLLLADTLDRVLEIQAKASARLIADKEKGMETRVSIMHFEAPQIKLR